MTMIHGLGRGHIYDLYNVQKSTLNDSIQSFLKRMAAFDQMRQIVQGGRADFDYSFFAHKFKPVDLGEQQNSEYFNTVCKDQLLFQIHLLAKELFPDDSKKEDAVFHYLLYRASKCPVSHEEFLSGSFNADKAEDNLLHFLKKATDGTLKSPEEKALRKEYLCSNEHKIEQLTEEINRLEKERDEEVQPKFPIMAEEAEALIDKLLDWLQNSPSFTSRSTAIKNNLREVLTLLKDACGDGERLLEFDIGLLDKKYTNILDDTGSEESPAQNFKALRELLEKLKNFSCRLNEIQTRIDQHLNEIENLKESADELEIRSALSFSDISTVTEDADSSLSSSDESEEDDELLSDVIYIDIDPPNPDKEKPKDVTSVAAEGFAEDSTQGEKNDLAAENSEPKPLDAEESIYESEPETDLFSSDPESDEDADLLKSRSISSLSSEEEVEASVQESAHEPERFRPKSNSRRDLHPIRQNRFLKFFTNCFRWLVKCWRKKS